MNELYGVLFVMQLRQPGRRCKTDVEWDHFNDLVKTNDTIQLLWTIIRGSANVPTYDKYFNDYGQVHLKYDSNATDLLYSNYPYPLAAANDILQNIFVV